MDSNPDLTLIQLSDTHIMPEGALMHDTVDTLANLTTVLDMITASSVSVSALLLSGDLTDSGKPEAYRRLRALVEPAAAQWGAQVVYAMGNHDERVAFRAELLRDGSSTLDCDEVRMVDGLRVVVLDSAMPGRHDGHLAESQLDWLATVLAEPAPRGSILMLHHPPIPSPVPTVNLLRLREAERLAAVLAGTDVRLIVTGHAHHTGCGALAGIPVWVSPAIAYGVEPVPPRDRLRASASVAFSRIDVFGSQIVATAVPVPHAHNVYDRDEAEMVRFVRDVVSSG